jgi:hypothetical protein
MNGIASTAGCRSSITALNRLIKMQELEALSGWSLPPCTSTPSSRASFRNHRQDAEVHKRKIKLDQQVRTVYRLAHMQHPSTQAPLGAGVGRLRIPFAIRATFVEQPEPKRWEWQGSCGARDWPASSSRVFQARYTLHHPMAAPPRHERHIEHWELGARDRDPFPDFPIFSLTLSGDQSRERLTAGSCRPVATSYYVCLGQLRGTSQSIARQAVVLA